MLSRRKRRMGAGLGVCAAIAACSVPEGNIVAAERGRPPYLTIFLIDGLAQPVFEVGSLTYGG
jgi:hypothetical protein